MKKIIIFWLFFAFIFSCKKDVKNIPNNSTNSGIDDNNMYDEANSLDKTKTFYIGKDEYYSKKITQRIGDIYYTATIMPIDYYIKKNLKIFDKDSLKYYRIKLKGEKIVQFEFQQKEKKDLLQSSFTNTDYESAVKYMSFSIKNDFYGINSKGDTIYCRGILFERNFKLAPFKRILIYFKDQENINSLKLVYNDNLFQNGLIKFNLWSKP